MSHSTEGPLWHRYLRFWKTNGTADVDEEIRLHFEARETELIAHGHSPIEAKRIAAEDFGDIDATRERLYAIRQRVDRRRERLWWWNQIRTDLRYAFRGLKRSPGFAAAVIATIALGIGANAAVFSVVDRLLFRAPPLLAHAELTRRVYVHFPVPDGAQYLENMPYPRYLDVKTWSTTLERTALFARRALAVGAGEDAREVSIAGVSASFFDFFDGAPVLGRYFGASEDTPPSGAPVAVLSYAAWKTHYAARSTILGEKLQIGTAIYTVIGVAPRGFVGVWADESPEVFVPFSSFADLFGPPGKHDWMRYSHGFGQMLVQLKRGTTPSSANSDLTHALSRSWAKENRNAKPPAGWYAVAASALSERGPMQTLTAKVALLVGGMGIIVLLIAGANVANLLLARALRRRREIAVRLALGVKRGRLLSQLLVESILLAFLGGATGLVAAQWGGSALRSSFLPPGSSAPVMMDTRTLILVSTMIGIVGFASGLAPAFTVRRTDVIRHLKISSGENATHRSPTRIALLIFQAALSMILLVGAGLFVRSLLNARHTRLGYDVDPILIAGVDMRGQPADPSLHDRLLAAARRNPSVERAALQLNLPFRGLWIVGWFRAPGVDSSALRRSNEFYMNAVSADYFATIGTRMVRGRPFDAHDDQKGPGTVIVSASLAKLLWPEKDAIGQCVQIDADRSCRSVVGVAEDIKNTHLGEDAGLYYYLPAAQYHPEFGSLVLRIRGKDAAMRADEIRRALQKGMPGASYVTVKPFADVISEQTRSWQVGSTVFIAYGVIALLVAAVGLFSVIAYDVEQRRHELGVRLALGAEPEALARLVLGRGMFLATTGLIIGGAIALASANRVSALLFEVSPRDPVVYIAAAALILGISGLASFVPAFRASRLNPASALRTD
jgi:putative ABC transport system permease protein